MTDRQRAGHVPTEGERVEALREMGLPRAAPLALIRQRYRQLARACHPDHHPNQPGKAERFQRLAAAYEILTRNSPPSTGDGPTGPQRPRADSPLTGAWWDQFGHLV